MKIVALALLLVPAIAVADPDPTTAPGFVTIDRFDRTSRIGGELSYMFPRSSNDSTVFRFDLHGQYVDPHSGIGGYLQLPFSHLSGNGASATGVGDAEIGALWAPRLASRNVGLVVRAGLTLPTGSTAGTGATGLDSVFANYVGAFTRITDFYLAIPKGTSLRVSVSPLVRQGQLFGRADLGADINLSQDGGGTADTVIRVNVAGGIQFATAALMAEFTNLYVNSTSNPAAPTGTNWVNTFALAARFFAGGTQPYVAVIFPLDNDAHNVFDAVLTLGIEGVVH